MIGWRRILFANYNKDNRSFYYMSWRTSLAIPVLSFAVCVRCAYASKRNCQKLNNFYGLICTKSGALLGCRLYHKISSYYFFLELFLSSKYHWVLFFKLVRQKETKSLTAFDPQWTSLSIERIPLQSHWTTKLGCYSVSYTTNVSF